VPSSARASDGLLEQYPHPLEILRSVHVLTRPLGGVADDDNEIVLERAQLLELLALLERARRKSSQAAQCADAVRIESDVTAGAGEASLA
jgi:hypothetical protein